jgi:hypothetical protein
VLGGVFASFGSYAAGASYVAGLTPALRVGVAVVVVGAPLAHHLPAPCRPDAFLGTAVEAV